MTGTAGPHGSVAYTSDELAWSTVEALQLLLGERGAVPSLGAVDEAELAARIALGDVKARRLLVEANLGAVAAAVRRCDVGGLPLLDLIQQGILGLLRAVESFDPQLGAFPAHAERSIDRALEHALSERARTVEVPLCVAEGERRIGRAERTLASQLGRSPRDFELAAAAGMSVAQLRAAWQAVWTDSGDDEDDAVARVQLELELHAAALGEAVAALPELERQVLVLRYGIDGGTPRALREAARLLGVPPGELVALEEQALERLELEREIQALRHAA